MWSYLIAAWTTARPVEIFSPQLRLLQLNPYVSVLKMRESFCVQLAVHLYSVLFFCGLSYLSDIGLNSLIAF